MYRNAKHQDWISKGDAQRRARYGAGGALKGDGCETRVVYNRALQTRVKQFYDSADDRWVTIPNGPPKTTQGGTKKFLIKKPR